jgi:co-chaperonin GroES (HSP10)
LPTTFGAPQFGLQPKGLVNDYDGPRVIEDALPPYRTTAEVEDFAPIQDQVVIERFVSETAGSFIVPEVARREHRYARVIAAGPGIKHPLSVKAGDIVLLPPDIRRKSERMVFGREAREYTVIREGHILGVVDDE